MSVTVCNFIYFSGKNVGKKKRKIWHWVFETEGRVVVGAMNERQPHTKEVNGGGRACFCFGGAARFFLTISKVGD